MADNDSSQGSDEVSPSQANYHSENTAIVEDGTSVHESLASAMSVVTGVVELPPVCDSSHLIPKFGVMPLDDERLDLVSILQAFCDISLNCINHF